MPITDAELTLMEAVAEATGSQDTLRLINEVRELQRQLARKPRSKKQRVEDALRESDLGAQLAGRTDIEYGHHETLPRGEHVARRGSLFKQEVKDHKPN